MTTSEALAGLGSLAQETRLEAFRLLVRRGPEGLSAGAIAEALQVPASSLSFHLHQLMHAGLVTQERRSRQLIYAADYDRMNALVGYLTENCCAGASCGPVGAVQCPPPARPVSARAGGRGRR
ncbi:MAG TPA: metalloregulator ArsR/SmtB family transcription factor [Myxococcaceae bacterium]|nr:metalloregulator ArsR/SmtB family transcription factor [Myxococcaceae bacterium]